MRNLTIVLTSSLLFLGSFLFAKEVPIKKAKEIAKSAYSVYAKSTKSDLRISSEFTQNANGRNYCHIFNFEGGGFIIISADDNYRPILGFSELNTFNFNSEEVDLYMGQMMEGHRINMDFIAKNKKKRNLEVEAEWQLVEDFTRNPSSKSLAFNEVVSPLTTTLWGQAGFYNAECPADPDGVNGNTFCGCVPVAVSQLIKYHNHPVRGNNSGEYVSGQYGTQSADFCNTFYNWSNMPDDLTAPNADVSELIYQTGVAMQTEYSTSYSGTFTNQIPVALINNFGYDNGIKHYYGTNHNTYIDIVTTELNQSRPVILGAFSLDENDGADVGHCWVADGYGNDMNGTDYIHFNWGWDGYNNGWFLDYMDIDILDGYWDPLDPNNESIPYFWYRDTYYEIFPADDTCQAPATSSFTPDPSETYCYIYFSSTAADDEEINYEYRVKGTSTWQSTGPISNYFVLISNLSSATTYEYRAERNCCTGWSNFSDILEFTTEGDIVCPTEEVSGIYANGITNSYAWMYTSQPYGAVPKVFRFRANGSSNAWVETVASSSYYGFAGSLTAGTDYEFQINHECQSGVWTGFSGSQTFTTTGSSPEVGGICSVEDEANLYTSSISDNFAYAYTSRPHGNVDNQFRYKPQDSNEAWTETSISTNYYRALTGLTAGTIYEFQVNHNCSTGTWSGYSDSHTFTTTGSSPEAGCAPESASGLSTTSVSKNFAWMYTSRPHGIVDNQFRHRIQGSVDGWNTSDISTNYYRAATGLSANSTYEFQVNHLCGDGSWSGWSDSQTYTTLPELGDISSFVGRDIQIYPNPVNEFLNIQVHGQVEMELLDLQGKILEAKTLDGSSKIDLSTLSNGIYMLSLQRPGMEREMKKIIKL